MVRCSQAAPFVRYECAPHIDFESQDQVDNRPLSPGDSARPKLPVMAQNNPQVSVFQRFDGDDSESAGEQTDMGMRQNVNKMIVVRNSTPPSRSAALRRSRRRRV
jgi:hypothetical protein